MSRLNEERKNELESKRFEYAKNQLIKAGFEITIVDGRGIHKLIKQLK